jgi:hypothetical protein
VIVLKKNTSAFALSRLRIFALIIIVLWVGLSCANVGNPNGGPYDEVPPKFIGSNPALNQLNFQGKVIEIEFDEFVSVDNPSENVIVTPPQKQNPTVLNLGKKIRIELKDTLKENTTYTIDFTSSVADNNEKNVLENFSFAFSTGDVLDTMKISGRLIDAETLEPIQKIMVGIHNDLSDTAFVKTPFLRTSKTNERGRFVIHNITPGEYHVFALEDKNRNYAYDKNADEGLAFLDTAVHPYALREMVPDTIWKDTITIDTVMLVEKTIFYPNDLILWYFKDSIAPRQRMLKPDRPQDFVLSLKFNAPMDTFPVPQPVNFEPVDSVWYVPQRADDAESFGINYWILDSMIYNIDTLEMAVSYWKNNDSIPDLLELQTDTVSLVNKNKAAEKKKPKRKPPRVRPNKEDSADSIPQEPEKEPVIPLQVSISPAGTLNPEDVIKITLNEPVLDVKKEFFTLELGKDTLWEAADFEFVEDSTIAMTYYIKRPFGYDERYRLLIDSATLCSVYGHCNEKASINFTVKTEKDYAHLSVAIEGLPRVLSSQLEVQSSKFEVQGSTGEDSLNLEPETSNLEPDSLNLEPEILNLEPDSLNLEPETSNLEPDSLNLEPETLNPDSFPTNPMPAIMELLNGSGSPVRKAAVIDGVATFRNMAPEKYYARIILDENGNGKWDAGNYAEKRQPERVIYFMTPKTAQFDLTIPNWSYEETWDVSTVPIGEKPQELLKNKPKETTRQKRDYREESKPRNSRGSSSPNIRGLPL